MGSTAQSQGHLSSLAAHGALSARGLGVHKELGGDRTRTADLNWPKGYSILCDIMWEKKKKNHRKGKLAQRAATAQGPSVSRQQAIDCASFVLYIYIYIVNISIICFPFSFS